MLDVADGDTPNIDVPLININTDLQIAGKICKNLNFWEENLNASPFVLSIIKHGYSIPFVEKPKTFFAKNNASSLKNRIFVETSI